MVLSRFPTIPSVLGLISAHIDDGWPQHWRGKGRGPGSQRWPAAVLPKPALRSPMIDMCRNESQNTRNGRESTQDHLFMSQHAWNCLELLGIARGCLEFIFLKRDEKIQHSATRFVRLTTWWTIPGSIMPGLGYGTKNGMRLELYYATIA